MVIIQRYVPSCNDLSNRFYSKVYGLITLQIKTMRYYAHLLSKNKYSWICLFDNNWINIIAFVICFLLLTGLRMSFVNKRKNNGSTRSNHSFLCGHLFKIYILERPLHVPVFFIYKIPITVRYEIIQLGTVCGLIRGR